MKLKIIVLKRKFLTLVLTTILILITTVILVLIYFKPTSIKDVFTSTFDKKIISYDLDGDGKSDTLYLKNNNTEYNIEISIKNHIYNLECSKTLPSLGKPNTNWPANVTICDISRDKLPEIFVQSSDGTTPIQHIFTLDKEKYTDIFCSNGNILGFLDYKNNKTPKFISGKISNGSIDLGFYMLSDNKLQNYSYNVSNLPGKDVIVQFIPYLESLPYDEAYKPSIFFNDLGDDDIYPIGKMSAECSSIKFLDGIFYDTKWTKDGSILELKWNLNLKGILKNNENSSKIYTLKLTLKPDPSQNNRFKIKLITF